MIFIALFSVLAAACKKQEIHIQTDVKPPAAELRILNSTPYTITSCTVNPGTWSTEHNYGRVGISEFSNYYSFDTVYRYGYINVHMNNKTYELFPIDYMGETPLRLGRFTYKLTYLPPRDQLWIEFIQD